jgi:hypothetical protein
VSRVQTLDAASSPITLHFDPLHHQFFYFFGDTWVIHNKTTGMWSLLSNHTPLLEFSARGLLVITLFLKDVTESSKNILYPLIVLAREAHKKIRM